MNFALISIIALALAIAIGVIRKVNIGIVALFFAFALGHFVFSMNVKTIYAKGWPIEVFFVMMSAMFLFSFGNVNGAVKLLARKLAYSIRNYTKLLPLTFFIATGLLTGFGADPFVVAFMLPIALMASQGTGLHPLVLVVGILAGAIIGGCSPFSVIGIVTSGLAAKQGFHNYYAIWAATATTMGLQAFIVWLIFGGYKIKKATGEHALIEKPEPFNFKQKQTLCVIAFALILIVFFKMNIGGAAFIGTAIMLALGVADEKECFKVINWNVLLLVGGTGTLVYVMTEVGGIKMLSAFLSSIMGPSSAAPLMAAIAGAMTFVSSATGVVMPALFPTVTGIAKHVGINSAELMQVLQAGSVGSVSYSPLSALGAIAFATMPDHVDKQKVFTEMLIIAIASLIFTMLLAYFGLFKLFL